ncbi:hypothetical protein MCAP1_000192 [Malassezia caprae]|uniref:Inner nuclear membrane protein SRC1 n=1 Tax=Malassezia caprae TaxID=1381934 RepID=A0AAF0E4F5_9BASI|nr:hypothetical protein MCAP1_000192 [Malassezia caprae]
MDVDPQVDAATLRVVDLRRILQSHRVSVPSTARKATLVEAFEKHVRPALLGAAPADEHRDPGASSDAPTEPPAAADLPLTPQPPAMDIRFSDDNPFQRDSVSPPSAKKSRSPTEGAVKKATPPSARRSTRRTSPKNEPATPSPAWPTTPAGQVRRRTPQQARQLAMRSERPAPVAHTPSSAPPARALRWTVLRWLIWAAALVWFWYCWQTRQAGYCTSGTVPLHAPRRTPSDVWTAMVSPDCVPCPEHGVCAGGRLTGCTSTDYVVSEPWQARVPVVAQALPLSLRKAQCVPDTFKLVLASELADALVGYLAHWHGQVRCQRATAYPVTPSHALGAYAVPEVSVKETLFSRITESIDAPTYEAIWALALEGLQTHAPDEMLILTHGRTRWLVATHASMPVSCRLRLLVRDWAWRNRLRGALLLCGLVAVFVAYKRIQQRRRRLQQTAVYAREVFQRLQAQAAQAEREGTPRELPVLHLRDTVLEFESRPHVRQRLWAPVIRVVQQNANVRSRQAQWHGEWQHVWEWMGMVPSTPTHDTAAPSPSSDADERGARPGAGPSTPAGP